MLIKHIKKIIKNIWLVNLMKFFQGKILREIEDDFLNDQTNSFSKNVFMRENLDM